MIVYLKHISVNPAYEDPGWFLSFWELACRVCAWTVVEVDELQRGIDPLGQFYCGSSPPFCSSRCFMEEPRWTMPFLCALPEDAYDLAFSFFSIPGPGKSCGASARHRRAPTRTACSDASTARRNLYYKESVATGFGWLQWRWNYSPNQHGLRPWHLLCFYVDLFLGLWLPELQQCQ